MPGQFYIFYSAEITKMRLETQPKLNVYGQNNLTTGCEMLRQVNPFAESRKQMHQTK
jgi:hypothetical protein